jgi:hypothetical protein
VCKLNGALPYRIAAIWLTSPDCFHACRDVQALIRFNEVYCESDLLLNDFDCQAESFRLLRRHEESLKIAAMQKIQNWTCTV